jgi:hypothetical protein
VVPDEKRPTTLYDEPQGIPGWYKVVLLLVVVLLVLSLILHIWTLTSINQARGLAREQVSALTEQVRTARNEVVSADVHIDQSLPVELSVPIQKELSVPIDTSVRIDHEVDVTVGGVNVPIPLKIDVPVQASVPVEINEQVEISTTVDLDMDLPVSVPVSDTVMASYLDELYRVLIDLEGDLGAAPRQRE